MSFECSNPGCAKAFDYRRGQLFRFHNEQTESQTPDSVGCCIRHFWLCDGCSRTHLLEYHPGLGVVIKPRSVKRPEGQAFRPVCCCAKSRVSACVAEGRCPGAELF
jgi:hypothetical protein